MPPAPAWGSPSPVADAVPDPHQAARIACLSSHSPPCPPLRAAAALLLLSGCWAGPSLGLPGGRVVRLLGRGSGGRRRQISQALNTNRCRPQGGASSRVASPGKPALFWAAANKVPIKTPGNGRRRQRRRFEEDSARARSARRSPRRRTAARQAVTARRHLLGGRYGRRQKFPQTPPPRRQSR